MYRPRTNDIHHPTLWFMHKWIGCSLFPRLDFRTMWVDYLKLLYAMVKRRKVSPAKFMMNQWKDVFDLTGDVECSSLVTRIGQNLGLLSNASIFYIDMNRWYLDYDYFCHAHTLKKRKMDSSSQCILGTQTRFRYLTGILVCIL